jgi:hypothetical protein
MRAGSLLITVWATAVRPGIADAAQLIEAEVNNAITGPLSQHFLGVTAEVLLAAGRPADGLGILRSGAFGQHLGFSGQGPQSEVRAR